MANGVTIDENLRRQIEREARAAGVSPENIDPAYIRARQTGTTGQYTRTALERGRQLRRTRERDRGRTTTRTRRTEKLPEIEVPDYSAQIRAITEQRRQQFLDQLKAQRMEQVGALQRQIPGIERIARTARGQTDVESLQAGRNLRQQMAEAGLLRSGQNVSGNIALQAARQEQLGGITQTEQARLSAIEEQIAQVEAQTALQRSAGLADISSQEQALLLQEMQQAPLRQLQAQQAQLALQRSQLELGYLPQQYQQQLQQGQAALQRSQLELGYLPQQYQQQLQQGSLALQQGQLGLQRGQLELGYLPQQYEQQLQQGSLALQQGQLGLQRGQLELDYLPQQYELGLQQQRRELQRPFFRPETALDLELKRAQIDKIRAGIQADERYTFTEKRNLYQSALDQLNSMVNILSRQGNSDRQIRKAVLDEIKKAADERGILPDDIATLLLRDFNIIEGAE